MAFRHLFLTAAFYNGSLFSAFLELRVIYDGAENARLDLQAAA